MLGHPYQEWSFIAAILSDEHNYRLGITRFTSHLCTKLTVLLLLTNATLVPL